MKRLLDDLLYELNYSGWANIYFNLEYNTNTNIDYNNEGYKNCNDIYAIYSTSLDKLAHLNDNYINKLKDINNTIALLHNKLNDEYGWIYRLII